MKNLILILIMGLFLLSSCSSNEEVYDNYGNLIPENCEVWYDGCNSCDVFFGTLRCTMKACSEDNLEVARCKKEK